MFVPYRVSSNGCLLNVSLLTFKPTLKPKSIACPIHEYVRCCMVSRAITDLEEQDSEKMRPPSQPEPDRAHVTPCAAELGHSGPSHTNQSLKT